MLKSVYPSLKSCELYECHIPPKFRGLDQSKNWRLYIMPSERVGDLYFTHVTQLRFVANAHRLQVFVP